MEAGSPGGRNAGDLGDRVDEQTLGDRTPPYGKRSQREHGQAPPGPVVQHGRRDDGLQRHAGEQIECPRLVRDELAGTVGVADLHEGDRPVGGVDLQERLAVGPPGRADVQHDADGGAEHLAQVGLDAGLPRGDHDLSTEMPPRAGNQPAGEQAMGEQGVGPGLAGTGEQQADRLVEIAQPDAGVVHPSPRPWIRRSGEEGSGERSGTWISSHPCRVADPASRGP